MAVKLVQIQTIPVIKVIELAYAGTPGPPGADGPPGPPGSSAEAIIKTCAAVLVDSRVVKFLPDNEMDYANADELGDRRISLGLTKSAGGIGDEVEVLTQGEWTQGAWSWTPGGPVYLALDGNLTQTVPTSPTYAFLRVMGVATDTDTIYFKPDAPVILA